MIADFHIHTPYCGHASGKTVHFIEKAIALGIKEIGFADHLGRYYLTRTQKRRYWDWGMDDRNLSRYFSELSELKSEFEDSIAIRIGLEIDYIEGAEDLLAPFTNDYSFDFLLGSLHCIPRFGWKHLSEYHDIDHEKIYREYFRLARNAIASGLFNSLAHLDFLWRYVKFPPEYESTLYDEIEATLLKASEYKMPIEINANGFLWSQMNHSTFNPFHLLLERIAKHSIQVTIGSDAHEPNNVGKAFPDLLALLREKNITTYATFSEGKMQIQELFT